MIFIFIFRFPFSVFFFKSKLSRNFDSDYVSIPSSCGNMLVLGVCQHYSVTIAITGHSLTLDGSGL